MTKPERVPIKSLPLEWRTLVAAAAEARDSAYVPYSHFPVGAALRTSSDRIFAGCNVENASFGLTVCAERVAMWNAISEGEREFEALVVITDTGSTPCGSCRQVMREFVADMPILIADTSGYGWLTSLRALLPEAFSPTDLAEEHAPHPESNSLRELTQ